MRTIKSKLKTIFNRYIDSRTATAMREILQQERTQKASSKNNKKS
jgi:hypothetical protein